MSFSSIIALFLSFQMQEFVVKWVTQFGDDGTAKAGTAFKLALLGEAGSGLVAFALVQLLAPWGAVTFAKNPEFAWVFRSLAVVILLQMGQQSLIGMLQVKHDFRTQGLIQATSQTASTVGIALVFLAGGGIAAVVAVNIGAAALTAALLWTFGLRAAHAVLPAGWVRSKRVPLGGFGREMARFAFLGNLRGTLSSATNSGNLLVLGFLSNPLGVGYYKLATSIAGIAALPNSPLSAASFPDFVEAYKNKAWDRFRSLMRRGSAVAALWFVPAAALLLILANPAIALLYGPAFLPAVPALAILLVGVTADGVMYWETNSLLAMGEPGYLATVALVAMVVKYTLAFLFVPIGGYLVMAAADTFVVIGKNILNARRTLRRLRANESMTNG
jgi:PST family polysaccharide transporter